MNFWFKKMVSCMGECVSRSTCFVGRLLSQVMDYLSDLGFALKSYWGVILSHQWTGYVLTLQESVGDREPLGPFTSESFLMAENIVQDYTQNRTLRNFLSFLFTSYIYQVPREDLCLRSHNKSVKIWLPGSDQLWVYRKTNWKWKLKVGQPCSVSLATLVPLAVNLPSFQFILICERNLWHLPSKWTSIE